MTLLALAYLAAGAARECVVVWYYLAVSTKRPLLASGLAGVIELFDLLVLVTILTNWSLWNAVAYAVGVVAGTALAVKRSK